MASTFRKEMIVEFADTDLAGIAHFSQFFLYAERTEHAFLRSLGLSLVEDDENSPEKEGGGRPGWPRVHASFDYLAPLRFEDQFAVTLGLERIGERSVHYRFLVEKGDQVCGRGKLVAAHVRIDPCTGLVEGAPVPDSFRAMVRELDEAELAVFLD